MGYKKILVISAVAASMVGFYPHRSGAAEPVILNPNLGKELKFITEEDLKKVETPKAPASKATDSKTTDSKATGSKVLSTKIQYSRRVKKRTVPKIEQKPADIDKLIEYNDFEQADKWLKIKMNQNPKDVQARALWLVSLAKQCKLDPAQAQLDKYLKANPKNPDLHYAQGIVYFKRTTSSNMVYRADKDNLYKKATGEFKKAMELNPKDARYYNAAGVISLNQGNVKEAKDYFQKAVSIDKTYSTAIDNLGTIDYLEGKFDDAGKKYQQALVYNTGNATAMYHLAQLASAKGDYATAAMHLNNSIYINPEAYAAYNLLGEVYQKQGNEAAAINAFKKALMIKPEFPHPYLNLAEIYEQRNDAEFAIEQLRTALSISPDFYDARLKIADISLANAKYNQAIENYSALVGIEGYNSEALKGLASAYFEQAQISSSKAVIGSNKDYFKALEYVNKAIAANSGDLELHLAKLKLAKITDQPEVSQVELQQILSSPNTDLINTVIKGEAYLTLNNRSQAKLMFDLASRSTKSIDDDLYLSEIFIYHGQFDCAKNVLNSVLKNDPQNQQALSSLNYISQCEKNAQVYLQSAQYYLKAKNYNATMEYLSKALALNPNFAQAYFLMGELFEKQKNCPDALANYKISLELESDPQIQKEIQDKIKRLEN